MTLTKAFTYCPHHDRNCLVPEWQIEYWPDFAREEVCIQEDDLTTLMINRAVKNNHPFIDHLKSLKEYIEAGRCFNPKTELSPEDFQRWLHGERDMIPADCSTVSLSDMTKDECMTMWRNTPIYDEGE